MLASDAEYYVRKLAVTKANVLSTYRTRYSDRLQSTSEKNSIFHYEITACPPPQISQNIVNSIGKSPTFYAERMMQYKKSLFECGKECIRNGTIVFASATKPQVSQFCT